MDHPAHDEDLEAYRAGEGDVVTLPVFQQTKVIPLEFPAIRDIRYLDQSPFTIRSQ
jgi:hypothetical protein